MQSAWGGEAKGQRRSRSLVAAGAVRDYVARQHHQAFTTARERTLRDGLALAPAARLQLAEELWQEFARGRKPTKPWTPTFAPFDAHEPMRREGGERAALRSPSPYEVPRAARS